MTHISDETHRYNLSLFPAPLRISISELLSSDLNLHDQLLVIYYNKFSHESIFSFEHLCKIAGRHLKISCGKLIQKFRRSNQWDLRSIGDRRITFLINTLLS